MEHNTQLNRSGETDVSADHDRKKAVDAVADEMLMSESVSPNLPSQYINFDMPYFHGPFDTGYEDLPLGYTYQPQVHEQLLEEPVFQQTSIQQQSVEATVPQSEQSPVRVLKSQWGEIIPDPTPSSSSGLIEILKILHDPSLLPSDLEDGPLVYQLSEDHPIRKRWQDTKHCLFRMLKDYSPYRTIATCWHLDIRDTAQPKIVFGVYTARGINSLSEGFMSQVRKYTTKYWSFDPEIEEFLSTNYEHDSGTILEENAKYRHR